MPNIIQRLKDTYSENPAKALEMLPKLFKAVDNGKIVELPYPIMTKEEMDSMPKLDRKALFQRLKQADQRKEALEEQKK